jgi:uncharacterized protein (DUF885 family)
MIGRLEIERSCEAAQQRQGTRIDIKAFHETC